VCCGFKSALCISAVLFIACASRSPSIGNNSCSTKIPFEETASKHSENHSSSFGNVTEWVKNNKIPIISILVSRDGEILYEYYRAEADRTTSRNTFSITKSITSALVGIAHDRGLIRSLDDSVSAYLADIVSPAKLKNFERITIANVMAMSALDARTWPKTNLKVKNLDRNYHFSSDRVAFALTQKTVNRPGKDFVYSDVTPAIISGILHGLTNKNLLDFGNEALFHPMGFKNQGWLFRDKTGYESASYGLELRPIDMHKFGVLYLNNGCWNQQQLISSQWVQRSLTPQIRSNPKEKEPNYGWYWWKQNFKPGWIAHVARGWHGQRLAIFPQQKVVVTITAEASDEFEENMVKNLFSVLLTAVEPALVK